MGAAKYQVLAENLRGLIRSGQLAVGAKLPSFTALNQQYAVTQATIESALSLLADEGLIERRHRSGVYVRAPQAPGSPLAARSRRGVIIVTEVSLDLAQQPSVDGMSATVVFKALAACQRLGLSATLLHPTQVSADDVAACTNQPPSGIIAIIASPQPNLLALDALLRLPVARAGWGSHGYPLGMPLVEHDHAAGAATLTTWLISKGRRRLLQLRPPGGGGAWMEQRRTGHVAEMQAAHLEVLPAPMLPTGPEYLADEAAFLATARAVCGHLVEYLISKEHPIDAILAPSDGFVPALARACRLCGLIPNVDVALVGYDAYGEHIQERRFEDVGPLATIDKSNALAGEALVRSIMDQIANPRATPMPIMTPPTLIVADAAPVPG